MCKRLGYLVSVCLTLGLAGSASADLVLHWALDDGMGDTVFDSSGNNRDGSVGGTPHWVLGQIEGALDFDGSTNYINYDEEIVTGTCSIALWIMPRDLPYSSGYRAIVHNDVWTAGSIRGHLQADTSLFDFDVSGGGGVTSTTAAQSDNWYHVVAIFNAQTLESKLYVNGDQEASATGLSAPVFLGPLNFGAWIDSQRHFPGIMDDIRIYDRPLTEEEIPRVMQGDTAPELAHNPIPENEATDVPGDVTLSWTQGEFAATHDVYFGTAFEDVRDATRHTPLGVLVSQDQTATTYDPESVLEFGRTYYWRVDEVNGPPDNTIFQGAVWRFTAEPFSYPVDSVTATASSSAQPGQGPENTVNGSGLNLGDGHSTVLEGMWLSGQEPHGAWIQYEFDRVRKLHEMWVWNYNGSFESIIGYGLKDVTVEYSIDGMEWMTLGDFRLARAPGKDDYTDYTTVEFGGAAARHVRITAKKNWGGILPQYGLSEVRFFYVPRRAREPEPGAGNTSVSAGTVLKWRAGRGAASYEVYLSTDWKAVANGTALVATVDAASYEPGSLEYGKIYFWKIDGIFSGETPSVWGGDIWAFSTADFVVDDYESYTDDEGSRIFETWIDGLSNPAYGGSQVGYDESPFTEQVIVYGGNQSMPLFYDNSAPPFYSEAVRTWTVPQDWIVGEDLESLTLKVAVYGDPDNCRVPMYLVFNDSVAVVNPDEDAVVTPRWTEWRIPLGDLSEAALSSVRKVAIRLGDPHVPTPCSVQEESPVLTASQRSRIFIDEIVIGDRPGFTLDGTLRDKLTGAPIADANIAWHPVGSAPITGLTTTTSTDGSYHIFPMPSDYAITVEADPKQYCKRIIDPDEWVFAHFQTRRDFLLVPQPCPSLSHPVYRFRSPAKPTRYYFAAAENEMKTLLYDYTPTTLSGKPLLDPDGWTYDGVAFCTADSTFGAPRLRRFLYDDDATNVPAYVFEQSQLPQGAWTEDSEFAHFTFYAYQTPDDPTLLPVYRSWSATLGCHFYTIDIADRNALDPALWQHSQNAAWYVPACFP